MRTILSARRWHPNATGRGLLLAGGGLLLLAAALLAAAPAGADAIIDNGLIQLGVNDEGHLNVPGGTPSSGTGTTDVGLRYLATGAEATAPGCLCEGWGVSYDGAVSGFADEAMGPVVNLLPLSFTSSGTTAASVVRMGDLVVTHDFHPSSAATELYEVTVVIANTGASAHTDVKYRRVMDWDVEPTAFSEFVTIDTAFPPPAALVATTTNGFDIPDPLIAPDLGGGAYVAGPPFTSIVDAGPADHGALFDFNFGTLASGERVRFHVYYGASDTEAGADAALIAVDAQVWSFGQPATRDGPDLGTPNTFIFAFAGMTTCSAEAGSMGLAVQSGLAGNYQFGGAGPLSGYLPTSAQATALQALLPGLAQAEAIRDTADLGTCLAIATSTLDAFAPDPALTPPLPAIVVRDLEVVSWTTCTGSSGWMRVGELRVGTFELDTGDLVPPNTVLNLVGATVYLNEQTAILDGLEVNGIRIVLINGDSVTIGHTSTAVHVKGPPTCPPPPAPPGLRVTLAPP